jgi:hypothetical protein
MICTHLCLLCQSGNLPLLLSPCCARFPVPLLLQNHASRAATHLQQQQQQQQL